MKNLIWRELGSRLYLSEKAHELPTLDNCVYEIGIDQNKQPYLSKLFNSFSFDYKIYDLEETTLNRIVKTYTNTIGNLGVLYNGLKGTGKTVSAKILCNRLAQPTIIVDRLIPGIESFLNSMPQNITILVDEYEKIYGKSNDLLTMMDGVLNAEYRRVFILTTNELRIEPNLLQRPSRIRYVKEFTHLKPKIVAEIVNDILINPNHSKDCVRFISSLELITVDIVKSVLSEVNIHNESPEVFGHLFNVKKLTGKYNLFIVEENITNNSPLVENVGLYPQPNFDESTIGYNLEVQSNYFGRVTNVIDERTIEVTIYKKDIKGHLTKNIETILILRVENAYSYHANYLYDSNYQTLNKPAAQRTFNTILNNINPKSEEVVDNDDEDYEVKIDIISDESIK